MLEPHQMMTLSEKQQTQLTAQLKSHQHAKYQTNIKLADGHILKEFVVHPKVLRPEKMTSLYLARWLFYNNGIYQNKNVIDMGSGSGIQGIVMGLYGASHVTFSDLSKAAVANTKDNVAKFGIGTKTTIYQGDLFEKINEKADVVVFNHPFFSDHTIEQLLVSTSMLDVGKLIHRFLDDAKQYLTKEGVIIMPYFHVAGPINDPMVQAPQHGYSIDEKMTLNVKSGIQKGRISIYELHLKKE